MELGDRKLVTNLDPFWLLTCQNSCEVEKADTEDAMNHLKRDPNHQLQECIEPQLLQPGETQGKKYKLMAKNLMVEHAM